MNDIKVIFFKGCPNAERAETALSSAGVSFDVIDQTDLPEENPFREYSSPTILVDEHIIYGQKIGKNSSACSAEAFDEKDIKEKIKSYESK